MNHGVSVDSNKIKHAVAKGLPVSLETHAFQRSFSEYVDLVLAVFLHEIQRPEMQNSLSYAINELAANAERANAKRVFFADKNLDINDEADYEKAMPIFKADIIENLDYYIKLQKERGLYIKIILLRSGDDLIIEVRNNIEPTKNEFERILDKLACARKYSALKDVFPEAIDDSEGAGLGIRISLLMLRKIGMPDDNFSVLVENGETIMRMAIPIGKAEDADMPELGRKTSGFASKLA